MSMVTRRLIGIGAEGPQVRPVQLVLASLGLLVCTNAPSTYTALHVIDNGTSRTWISLYPFGAVAVCGAVGLGRKLATVPWRKWPFPLFPLAAFVTWGLMSGVWSVSPTTTAINAMLAVGIAAFGCWIGWCLTMREQLYSVVMTAAMCIVTSAIVVEWLPQYGKMYPAQYPDSNWQGVFGNRNSLAPMCVLAMVGLAGYVATHPSVARVVVSIPVLMSSVVLLRGSSGATSLAALAATGTVAVAVPLAWLLKRWRVPGLVVATGAVGACVALWIWVMTHFDQVARWLSRERTLSGRRLIWQDVRRFIRERPWKGYGLWAYWDRPELTSATYARLGAQYASAHNSALEVLLGLGVVGLIFYLAVVLCAIVGVAAMVWSRRTVEVWWWAMLLAFLFVENLMESFVLWHSYNWVLFIAAALVPFGASIPSISTVVAPSDDEAEDVGNPRTVPNPIAGAADPSRADLIAHSEDGAFEVDLGDDVHWERVR